MPRQRIDLREYHRPRHIGRAAPELAVDEVPQPAGREAERNERRDEVGHFEPALVPVVREQRERQHHADESTVKAHSALPQGQNLQWMDEVVRRLVEQNVAETAAENHPEYAVEEHVVDIARVPAREEI